MISASTPISNISPILEIPNPKIISNSVALNGEATLFFTTFTLVRLPIISPFPSLMAALPWGPPALRISKRTDE